MTRLNDLDQQEFELNIKKLCNSKQGLLWCDVNDVNHILGESVRLPSVYSSVVLSSYDEEAISKCRERYSLVGVDINVNTLRKLTDYNCDFLVMTMTINHDDYRKRFINKVTKWIKSVQDMKIVPVINVCVNYDSIGATGSLLDKETVLRSILNNLFYRCVKNNVYIQGLVCACEFLNGLAAIEERTYHTIEAIVDVIPVSIGRVIFRSQSSDVSEYVKLLDDYIEYFQYSPWNVSYIIHVNENDTCVSEDNLIQRAKDCELALKPRIDGGNDDDSTDESLSGKIVEDEQSISDDDSD